MLLRRVPVTASIAIAALSHVGGAQTATQVVRFQVNAINQVAVSGNPASLIISSATAGSAPSSVTANGATYAVTTNEANQKIIASLDQSLPGGLTLEVNLAAPAGASSLGNVSLGTIGADVVVGISATAAASLPITYRLSATPVVQMNASDTRRVTFTIVSGT